MKWVPAQKIRGVYSYFSLIAVYVTFMWQNKTAGFLAYVQEVATENDSIS